MVDAMVCSRCGQQIPAGDAHVVGKSTRCGRCFRGAVPPPLPGTRASEPAVPPLPTSRPPPPRKKGRTGWPYVLVGTLVLVLIAGAIFWALLQHRGRGPGGMFASGGIPPGVRKLLRLAPAHTALFVVAPHLRDGYARLHTLADQAGLPARAMTLARVETNLGGAACFDPSGPAMLAVVLRSSGSPIGYTPQFGLLMPVADMKRLKRRTHAPHFGGQVWPVAFGSRRLYMAEVGRFVAISESAALAREMSGHRHASRLRLSSAESALLARCDGAVVFNAARVRPLLRRLALARIEAVLSKPQPQPQPPASRVALAVAGHIATDAVRSVLRVAQSAVCAWRRTRRGAYLFGACISFQPDLADGPPIATFPHLPPEPFIGFPSAKYRLLAASTVDFSPLATGLGRSIRHAAQANPGMSRGSLATIRRVLNLVTQIHQASAGQLSLDSPYGVGRRVVVLTVDNSQTMARSLARLIPQARVSTGPGGSELVFHIGLKSGRILTAGPQHLVFTLGLSKRALRKMARAVVKQAPFALPSLVAVQRYMLLRPFAELYVPVHPVEMGLKRSSRPGAPASSAMAASAAVHGKDLLFQLYLPHRVLPARHSQ